MDGERSSWNGALFVLLGSMLWGTTGTSQALAPEGADSLAVGALRLVVGGAALLGMALVRGSFRKGGRWQVAPTVMAILATAFYQPFFFTGVSRTGVAVGTLVTLASSAVISGLLGYVFLHEKPAEKWYLSSLLAIAGCFLLTLSGKAEGTANPAGMLFSLGAGFSYSVFVLSGKSLLKDHGADAVNGLVFSAAGVLYVPVLIINPPLWLANPRGLLVAFHLGLVATALAYFLFLKGLSSVPASTGVTLSMAEPLTASMLGVYLLGERLNFAGGMGMALLFSGVALLALGAGSGSARDERRT